MHTFRSDLLLLIFHCFHCEFVAVVCSIGKCFHCYLRPGMVSRIHNSFDMKSVNMMRINSLTLWDSLMLLYYLPVPVLFGECQYFFLSISPEWGIWNAPKTKICPMKRKKHFYISKIANSAFTNQIRIIFRSSISKVWWIQIYCQKCFFLFKNLNLVGKSSVFSLTNTYLAYSVWNE